MKLNRFNFENDEDEKEDNNINEEGEEQEEIEEEEKPKKRKKHSKKNEEEEEKEEEEEYEEEHEENDYTKDGTKKQFKKTEGYKNFLSKASLSKPIKLLIAIIIIFICILIVVNIIIAIVKKFKRSSSGQNDEIKLINKMDKNKFNKLKDDLSLAFASNGEINLNKLYEENINEKSYTEPDSGLTNIHISIAFSESNIDEIIKHLSSALDHISTSSFLHIHMMNADNFTLDSFSKLMNMIHKINNHTEIKVYNARVILEDFKIREDKKPLFNIDYSRLFAFKAIKDVQKLIMLNINTLMIEKDLADLYNLDMNDIYGRGISEVPSIRHPSDWMDPYLFDKSHFINGDVILVNLELCKRDDFYGKAIELNNKDFYTKVEDPTQDILNVLMRKKIEFFNPKFNKISFYEKPEDKNDESKWYPWVEQTLKYGEKYNHFYTKEDLLSADSDAFIINYLWDKELGKKVEKYEEELEKYSKINGL